MKRIASIDYKVVYVSPLEEFLPEPSSDYDL